jgi:hypothetical protein
MMGKRTEPLSVIGVYEGPPPETKSDLGITLSNVRLHPLKCHRGLVAEEFDKFFRLLQEGSTV